MAPLQLVHQSLYLQPGKVYIGKEPVVVTTVLGSCIAVTLRHPATGFCAICHALQPVCPLADCDGHCAEAARYARCVVLYMASCFAEHRIYPAQTEVKLFGGGVLIGNNGPTPVGRLNVEAACQALKQCGYSLKAVEVGGQWGRKLVFDTHNGAVWVKRLNRNAVEQVEPALIKVAANSGR